MKDLIINFSEKVDHTTHLEVVFKEDRKYNMQLSLEKCTLTVNIGKLIGYYFKERGIKVNSDKWKVMIYTATPKINRNSTDEWKVDCIAKVHFKVCSSHPNIVQLIEEKISQRHIL